MDHPRNPALEAAIEADPFDLEAYRVYADWLEGQGDPRAQLIALQCSPHPEQRAGKAVRKLLADHQPYLLGSLARLSRAIEWKYGFIHGVALTPEMGALETNLANLFAHPSSRFLVALGISGVESSLIGSLAAAPKTLRALSLQCEAPQLVPLAPLANVIAQLSSLSLAGRFTLDVLARIAPARLRTLGVRGSAHLEALDLPAVETASFELDPLSPTITAAIANAKWPKLQRLVLGGAFDPQLLAPLFQRTDLPALTDLTIRGAKDGELLCALLRDAPFAKQLKRLELARGTLTDTAAGVLAARADVFDQLDELDASDNPLTDDGYAALDEMGVVDLVDDRRYDDMGE